ncbi:MAG: peptidoglycan DD-metalloendopeptidase family protein [bacterium]|nr:peptidoglycan DD-metalloendopeptidase family protein [bacterium]
MATLRRRAAVLVTASLALCATGIGACTWAPAPNQAGSSARGFYYAVEPGDNLYRIGKRFGVPTEVLERANRIRDVTQLRVGQRLYIPRRYSGGSGRVQARAPKADPRLARRVRDEARRKARVDFAWPMKRTRLTSRFGRRNGHPHEGIDLAAKPGTAIRAAESGKVIHAGRLGAYGRVVILKHAGDYRSVYAHARRLHVRKGQFVERAQEIAEVGMTGRTTGPHLHFEIRRKDVPKDPLLYLP